MTLYEIADTHLIRREPTSFANLERHDGADLRRLLREDVTVLGDDLLLIAEEYGEWEDPRGRVDLLAIDTSGHLVVVDIKRSGDEGHTELQALRYAAMVSSMGFDEVLTAFGAHCERYGAEGTDPRAELESFLDADGPGDSPVISSNVRIVLVAGDFGREITTTVLWLNGFEGLDVRCVRLLPYEIDGKVLLDVHQVIPLPTAIDYQVSLRRKDVARDRARVDGRDWTKYHVVVDGEELPAERKRQAVRMMVSKLVEKGVAVADIRRHFAAHMVRVLPGNLIDQETEAIREVLVASGNDAGRWFWEHPLYDPASDETLVLTRMWGTNTAPKLRELAEAFPKAGVSFVAADG